VIAQIFNSVADNIDVYMAGGGLGAFNGCHKVGSVTPMLSMYEKYPTADNEAFVKYLEGIGYPEARSELDHVMQWSGGIRGGKTYAQCIEAGNSVQDCQPTGNGCDGGGGICIQNTSACALAFTGKSDFVTEKARESSEKAQERSEELSEQDQEEKDP